MANTHTHCYAYDGEDEYDAVLEKMSKSKAIFNATHTDQVDVGTRSIIFASRMSPGHGITIKTKNNLIAKTIQTDAIRERLQRKLLAKNPDAKVLRIASAEMKHIAMN
jgi:hypothetical protein